MLLGITRIPTRDPVRTRLGIVFTSLLNIVQLISFHNRIRSLFSCLPNSIVTFLCGARTYK